VLIDHILQRKGTDVVTIGADTPVKQAVATLRQHNVGALVVVGDGDDVVGIISERDVVRALATDGAAVLGRDVRDLMSTEVTTCEPRSSVDDLMKVMTERRIRHIPVLEGERLLGIVSIGDVVKSRIGELEDEAETLHDYLSSGRT
jgi:CBS domain-containing protein